jgi:elongation factor Ts
VAIRENLGINFSMKLQKNSNNSMLVGYVHGRVVGSNAGSAAAVVEIVATEGASVDPSVMQEAGKRLAMHIVAARPAYLNPESVPADILEKERAILLSEVRKRFWNRIKLDCAARRTWFGSNQMAEFHH